MGGNSVDGELVRRVQQGDKRAFDVLVRKYQHKLLKLVSRYVHDMHEAQDVTQEAFIRAYRAINSFRGESAFYTWLYRIGINAAKNYLVSQGRRPPSADIEASEAEQFIDSSLQDHATPERLVLTDELEQVIQHTLDTLPEDLRTAITLRELEGMSYEEIAQSMSCPVGTVRSRIFRARDAIEQQLRPLLKQG